MHAYAHTRTRRIVYAASSRSSHPSHAVVASTGAIAAQSTPFAPGSPPTKKRAAAVVSASDIASLTKVRVWPISWSRIVSTAVVTASVEDEPPGRATLGPVFSTGSVRELTRSVAIDAGASAFVGASSGTGWLTRGSYPLVGCFFMGKPAAGADVTVQTPPPFAELTVPPR